MEKRSILPINFLYYRTETTVAELYRFLSVGQELIREAVALNIAITGPVHWHYYNFLGDQRKSFVLEIAIPVAEIPADYDGKFHFKRTDTFQCVSLRHDGSWLDMPVSYGKVFDFISQNKLIATGVNREIYVNADFTSPQNNVTEIQIGCTDKF